ncbi:MAG: Na+/H+ antiporter NhaC family protein [Lachnoclostridium edouardi]|uniref:Na+/H+ antiporter NhaC family protein n=1 Tax=Lachnoclostridium edouardi TaxID=1926283 RepID=UPI0026DAD1EC|nr:Na+/H+ antiporter NhaC family protein [Lachnoclostridium edouardi]MDO4277564.1 Na+/H+ antiporter NhaC family protein [Lachnoclostridium edouardi]
METVVNYGILSILPPLIAISLALITKQTVFSLIVGLWAGVTIINGWNPILALPKMISDFFIPLIANESNAGMLVLITACGGFVYMIKVSGASRAFGDIASKRVKTRTQAQLVTYFSAFAFIYTEPTLTLGSLMRPITERLKVSRVKLAYICDVMGCPFATLSPITSYSTYATSLIAAQFAALAISGNPWVTFVKAIPYNFYALFGMLALLFVIIAKLDIGPMYYAEKRAVETGALIGENDVPMSKYDMDEDAMFQGKNITILNFLAPIITLFVVLLAMIMWTGDAKTNGIGGAFMNSSITLCISLSFLVSAAVAGLMGVKSGVLKLGDVVPEFCKGVSLNSDIPLILILAWSIGSLTGKMDLKGYLIGLLETYNVAPGIMPMLIFIVGAFVGFSTGSSWGVWAITMPIALPIAHSFGVPIELMIGACLSGGVFGDHCSPISDTTILASTAAGADHIQHVRTQLPYSLAVGGCSAVGFLVGGMISPVLGLAVTALGIGAVFFGLHQYAVKRYGN